jgi:glycosyltransferase involved in cell wall biosynthesis
MHEMRGHIVMLVRNVLAFDTRVKKEAMSLAAHGFRVTVVARSNGELPEREELGGATVVRIPGVPRFERLAKRLPRGRRYAERVLRLLTRSSLEHVWWTHVGFRRAAQRALADLKPDAVHAHDLNTLYAGVACAKRACVPLVYDAHELEVARRAYPGRLARASDRYVERRGSRAAAARITVSPGIAAELARAYSVPEPIVVLNSPSIVTRDRVAPVDLRAALPAGAALTVYIGILPRREAGIEQVVEALALLPERHHFGLLGPPPSDEARTRLEAVIARHGVADRVHWFSPVPYLDVPAVVGTATSTINPRPQGKRQFDLALPNKFFDSIMAGAPVGVSRVPARARFVEEHGIGVVFDEADPPSIAAAIEELERLRDDPDLPARFARLQEEICWERQEEKLVDLYARLLG